MHGYCLHEWARSRRLQFVCSLQNVVHLEFIHSTGCNPLTIQVGIHRSEAEMERAFNAIGVFDVESARMPFESLVAFLAEFGVS